VGTPETVEESLRWLKVADWFPAIAVTYLESIEQIKLALEGTDCRYQR
jgi:hypothetical protein